MASDLFLFWGSGSPNCWRPMLALAEKGFNPKDYPNKLLEFSKKEHKSPEVLKINSRGQLPTFTAEKGKLVINESRAICDYVEKRFAGQGTKLYPDDLATRAKIQQRMFEMVNYEENVIKGVVAYKLFTPKDKHDQDLLKTKYESAAKELSIWEGYLKEQGPGTFLVGKNFTMADVFFFPILAFSMRNGLNGEKFPSLKEYFFRLKSRPSVQATRPPHWVDSDGDFSILGPV